ncbi:MAG: hypothetical protein CFE29_05305 [Bradyrhizobiaceae bacterium PARB1]|jgi:Alginate export|nr:MAG: hypothetical protein CFE29_05305 [Bradyrhizobiaceae bacterium PARB1]
MLRRFTQHPRHRRRACAAAFAVAALLVANGPARSDDAAARPKILSNRWQEDWSVLANPVLRTEPLDGLKYIPLFVTDPKSYISLGANLRERFEINDASGFGIGGVRPDAYLLQRLQMHVDVHLNENWQVFTQFEDVRAFDKATVTAVDQNQLDLRLAFVAYSGVLGDGIFKARAGRQDFAFDLQRFVSSRDGPNVRQSFDALWADYEIGPWRFIGFVSQPVQYRFGDVFDDISNRDFRFSTLRIERHVLGTNELSGYYSLYERSNARYLDAIGVEQRHIFDIRFAGQMNGLDWDLEAMGQTGHVAAKDIAAWALGGRIGYTSANIAWTPRIGLQADAASGDRHAGDGTIGTFNPLFPNGYYFTLAGYTGYANLIHVKPTLTVKPLDKLSITAGIGLQWRETTADAIYIQPNVAVAGTAGTGSRWSGVYTQLRADYVFNANLTGALEAVHYKIGDTLRAAGGHDSNYLGLELKYGW